MSAKLKKGSIGRARGRAAVKNDGTDSEPPIPPPFDVVVEGYQRALFLDHFLEAGRTPAISDLEIAVCFADLRGFTRYVDSLQSNSQDSRVHELIGSYFQIYPKAILETVYALEPRPNEQITARDEKIRKAIVPSMFKTLGDGMMLVWELGGSREIQDQVSGRILQVVATIRRLFKNLIEERVESAAIPYSKAIANLELGIGLARGRAWRLDFGRGRPLDYAGTIVNVAARLQDLARPEGIVAEVGFCDQVFRAPKINGQQKQVVLKGIVKPVDVWASPEVKLDF